MPPDMPAAKLRPVDQARRRVRPSYIRSRGRPRLRRRRSRRYSEREAFARDAADISFAVCRAIEGGIADNDVVFRHESRLARREYRQLAAGQSFADIVIGVAFQGERDAFRHERAEALSGRTDESEANRILRQAVRAVPAGHFAAHDRTDDAVDIVIGKVACTRFLRLERRLARSSAALHVQANLPSP